VVEQRGPLWGRLIGFTLLPAIAAISPLLVLPVVARIAGPGGWASAIAGESVGTVAAIVIGYGWTAIGPALVSIAADSTERARIYRESLVVRLLIAVAALPVTAVLCWFVAHPGSEWLSVLMGLQGALIALSFTWYSAGEGLPRAIMLYDAIPRLVVAVAAALLILQVRIVELYPLSGIAVTLVGTGLFSWRVLRRNPSPWPRVSELPALFRAGAPVALNDAGLGAYSSIPTPLVNITASASVAGGFASGDKMLKLGQFLPLTLANALQAWIGEVHGPVRRRRTERALLAHGVFGVLGWIVLGAAGAWASSFLFGADVAASTAVCVVLGLTFAFFSVRTSMTRHVLMHATLIGTLIGVPIMVVLAVTIGPLGAAIGYAVTEGAATILLVRRSREALRALSAPPAATP